MIKARHNPLVYQFFKHYAKGSIRRHFHEVFIRGKVDVENSAALVLSNHISWWDGFWALYLNMEVLKKNFHFMMDQEQLQKRWLFSHAGGYSINAGSRSLFESLKYTGELLSDPTNMVLIYPQAKLYSAHTEAVQFKRGLSLIPTSDTQAYKVIMLVQLTDYFENKRPTLSMFIEEAELTGKEPLKTMEAQYNAFYKRCKNQQSAKIV